MPVMRPPMNIGFNSVRNFGCRLKQWHCRAIWSWNFSYPYYPFFDILVTTMYVHVDDPHLTVQLPNKITRLSIVTSITFNIIKSKKTGKNLMVRVLLNVRCSSIITMNNGNTLYWKYNEQIPFRVFFKVIVEWSEIRQWLYYQKASSV